MDRSKIELIRSLRVYLLTCVQEKFSKQETEIFIDFLDELLETQNKQSPLHVTGKQHMQEASRTNEK